jgi:general transcription factor 3C polypeptide 3 (transcription factor C subunit 4)
MSDDDDIDRDEDELVDEMGRPLRRRRRYGRFPRESPPDGSRRSKGVKRGLRKPVEPSPEFKELHSAATLAFIDSDYDRAITLVKQAIQINPEIFAAHALLSEVFLAQGLKDKALAALFSGAHTRHRDQGVWMKVAKLIRERGVDNDPSMLRDLIYCYNRVIEVEPQNYDARFQRATAHRELGHYGKAALEYDRLLNDYPHNMDALRQLAESCIDHKDVSKALERYEESIPYYQALSPDERNPFSWSDVNIYTDLLGYKKEYMSGIVALRSLARWLLGRQDDKNWDMVKDDDREWDAEHSPRRISTPWFREDLYPLDSYGQGLPLELRVKLGVFRLKLSADYREEALVKLTHTHSCMSWIEYRAD